MSRYYSGGYDRLDDPDWNPNLDASESAVNLGSYEPVHAHEDDAAPLNRDTAYQPAVPATYLDSKYPPRGVRGWKSKTWDRWTGRKKIIVASSVIAAVVVIIGVVVGVSVAETEGSPFSYIQSFANVTNANAFASGGAVHGSPVAHDGIGAGEDTYTYYSGDASNFPNNTKWISYQKMWSNNLNTISGSCKTLGDGADDTAQEIEYIAQSIRNRSIVSLVDHRLILAVILQESGGCVHAGQTTSYSGVRNPGLMQSHDGHSYNPDHSQMSILAMVQDGVQGTDKGEGLVQLLNQYGNPYEAARVYNSGYIPKSGNLSEAAGATACYVSDIANRLTGWTTAPNTCPGQMGTA